jgi:hypothetical protein
METRTLGWGWLARSVLFILWSLAAWGALLLILTVLDVAREGFGTALGRLLPSRGASAWAWLNALSVALALAVGIVVAGLLAWGRRGPPKASSSGLHRP